MSKVKGRYVATVILDIEYDESEGRPFDEVYREIHSGGMAMAISDAIGENIMDTSMGSFTVEQQYADLYRVDEGLYKV